MNVTDKQERAVFFMQQLKTLLLFHLIFFLKHYKDFENY